jgi:hypothetical protein
MEETIRDVDAFYVKLADFYDNALSFHLVGDPDERKRRAKKYLPAFEKMLARLWEDAVAIAPERKIKISEDLAIGYTRAREILNEDA